MLKRALMGAAITLAALSAQAQTVLLNEDFNSVAGLGAAGWVFQNDSYPAATGDWFQGNSGIFASQAGADDAYIAANFLSAPPGGFIDNLLITPVFSLASDVILTFWARADIIDGFSDSFAVLAGITPSGGMEDVTPVFADTVATGGWTQYSVTLAAQGAGSTGRFAFEYFGYADTSNYIGLDTVTVTAVPEPGTYALMALGLGAIAFVRRRRANA
jgi:hypothetical protein